MTAPANWQSEREQSPRVSYRWDKTAADDSRTFLINVKRWVGAANGNYYQLAMTAD